MAEKAGFKQQRIDEVIQPSDAILVEKGKGKGTQLFFKSARQGQAPCQVLAVTRQDVRVPNQSASADSPFATSLRDCPAFECFPANTYVEHGNKIDDEPFGS